MVFKKFFNEDSKYVKEYAEKFDVLPSTMYLILSRGMKTEEEIRDYLEGQPLLDPFLISGMKELVERINLAKQLGDRVLIFGDYDVDGISATAIMLKALKRLGITADFYLPNRYEDGYGLTCEVIDKIEKQFCPDLIITVDCGISCYNEVEYIKSKGMEVIITDHHEIPEKIPNTLVLNAKLPNQAYPFRELCGAGLAYKISEALLGVRKAEEYLPIAAIATIADIVPLKSENRTIVKRGFSCFDKLPIGLKELFKDSKLQITKPDATDIAFRIAPKINSAGRMGKAEDSLMLYMSEDMVVIKEYIAKIKKHNTRRVDLSTRIMNDCNKAIKNIDLSKTRVICLASKKWDQGVLGIACARLVEQYNRPVFLFSQVGDVLHGSGRSINDINIHEVLSSTKDILETYGGHTMAAGVTLKRSEYEKFCTRVNAYVFEHISDQAFIPIKYYDLELKNEDITERFLTELNLLKPFGCGNPKPIFKITAEKVDVVPMKSFPMHCNIKIGDLDLVYFNFAKIADPLFFSRYKSFLFEFQGDGKRGNVVGFDAGSFIVENAHDYTYPSIFQQLMYDNEGAVFSCYAQQDLIKFVASLEGSVYGTCFVTYSAYEYVAFLRNYSKDNIFHIGTYDTDCVGYNSLLLSPSGIDWAKNFKRIIFLSSVLDTGFIAAIQKITDAEIFVPIENKEDKSFIPRVNLSREVFGRVFATLVANGPNFYSATHCFNKRFQGRMSFATFYVALLTFTELQIIKPKDERFFAFTNCSSKKKELTDSKIYRKLLTLQETYRKQREENI